MRPDDSDLTEDIRGHLAIDIKQRIDRREDPVSARREALKAFGYLPAVRDQMRRVWYSRWSDVIGTAIVLIGAAAAASLIPAMRASRVDVLQAFRSE